MPIARQQSGKRELSSEVRVEQVWTNPGSGAPTMFSAGGYQGFGRASPQDPWLTNSIIGRHRAENFSFPDDGR